MHLRIHKARDEAMLPTRLSNSRIGYGVCSAENATIQPGETKHVTTGLVFEKIDDRIVYIMSSLPTPGNHNVEIESRYVPMGTEVKIPVRNRGDHTVEIKPLEHLARILIFACSGGEPGLVDQMDETERGVNGYGSTGLL